jgi:hypothetical protein
MHLDHINKQKKGRGRVEAAALAVVATREGQGGGGKKSIVQLLRRVGGGEEAWCVASWSERLKVWFVWREEGVRRKKRPRRTGRLVGLACLAGPIYLFGKKH